MFVFNQTRINDRLGNILIGCIVGMLFAAGVGWEKITITLLIICVGIGIAIYVVAKEEKKQSEIREEERREEIRKQQEADDLAWGEDRKSVV